MVSKQDIQLESHPSLLHSPVGAGALLVAAEPHQLINTARVCQDEGRKTAAVGRSRN